MIAVEAISEESDPFSQKAASIAGLTETETGRRALMSLSTIDDHVILDTVTTLLELFNRPRTADESEKPSSNEDD